MRTLLPINRDAVETGSTIWSDEWAAYRQLGEGDGLFNETVNHSEEFVSERGTNTQNIEQEWRIIRHKIIKSMRSTSRENLIGHLDEHM